MTDTASLLSELIDRVDTAEDVNDLIAEYVARIDRLIQIKFAWVEVRHAPGYRDDGTASLSTSGVRPRPVPPETGLNGKKGTWTTVHKVFYDPTPDE